MAELEFAAAFLAKKGEDVSAHHDATLPDGSRLALFLVADGHGGAAVAVHLREQLLPAVAAGCADGTPASVEGALRAAFASLHAECQSSRFAQSGATATVVAVNVETGAITAANVGDSQALLLEENEPSKVDVLTVMHRWDRTEERERATMAGADVGQVSAFVARAAPRANSRRRRRAQNSERLPPLTRALSSSRRRPTRTRSARTARCALGRAASRCLAPLAMPTAPRG